MSRAIAIALYVVGCELAFGSWAFGEVLPVHLLPWIGALILACAPFITVGAYSRFANVLLSLVYAGSPDRPISRVSGRPAPHTLPLRKSGAESPCRFPSTRSFSNSADYLGHRGCPGSRAPKTLNGPAETGRASPLCPATSDSGSRGRGQPRASLSKPRWDCRASRSHPQASAEPMQTGIRMLDPKRAVQGRDSPTGRSHAAPSGSYGSKPKP
jgi:hypothetical protein